MKGTRIFLFCTLVLLAALISACAPNPADSGNMSVAASGSFSDDSSTPENMEVSPVWPQTTQEARLDNLNLDGIGGADDSVCVSSCRFGDFGDICTVLQVRLGTGETVAKVFPVRGRCTLQTASLFSPDKQALLLEVAVPNSNYGATRVFALDVFPPDPDPCIVTRLDTTSKSIYSASGEIFPFTDLITSGNNLVEIEGSALCGIELCYITPNDKSTPLYTTLVWCGGGNGPDDGWALIDEE